MSCKCKFSTKQVGKQVLADFLGRFGDDLPEPTIKEATKTLDNWHMICDCNNPKRIISAGHWVENDWYLCTIKHLATDKEFRGKGLGREVSKRITADALQKGCLVLAADVTTTNMPSQKIFESLKFDKVNTFCWQKGKKPANILHYVKTPPKNGECV